MQQLILRGLSNDDDLALKHELGTPGSNLLKLNDFIYDLAITANRPDGMSVIGIAREISALLESKLNWGTPPGHCE